MKRRFPGSSQSFVDLPGVKSVVVEAGLLPMVDAAAGWLQCGGESSNSPDMQPSGANRVAAVAAACLWVVSSLSAQEPKADPANDAFLAQLRDPDMEERIEALRELMTTLDPRLIDALLPLLEDEGNSIRRLAARAVGSRYWQVPAEKVPTFLEALAPLAKAREEHEDVANMADRAIGLLDRKYRGRMFATSPDGKWVIYERHGMPCLIDLERKSEELLGWAAGVWDLGWFSPSWSNGEVNDSVYWLPESRAVAMSMLLNRRESTFWVWIPKGSRLVKVTPEMVFRAIGVPVAKVDRISGFSADPVRWHEGEVQFDLYYTTMESENAGPVDHDQFAAWNLETGAIRLLPKESRPEDPGRN